MSASPKPTKSIRIYFSLGLLFLFATEESIFAQTEQLNFYLDRATTEILPPRSDCECFIDDENSFSLDQCDTQIRINALKHSQGLLILSCPDKDYLYHLQYHRRESTDSASERDNFFRFKSETFVELTADGLGGVGKQHNSGLLIQEHSLSTFQPQASVVWDRDGWVSQGIGAQTTGQSYFVRAHQNTNNLPRSELHLKTQSLSLGTKSWILGTDISQKGGVRKKENSRFFIGEGYNLDLFFENDFESSQKKEKWLHSQTFRLSPFSLATSFGAERGFQNRERVFQHGLLDLSVNFRSQAGLDQSWFCEGSTPRCFLSNLQTYAAANFGRWGRLKTDYYLIPHAIGLEYTQRQSSERDLRVFWAKKLTRLQKLEKLSYVKQSTQEEGKWAGSQTIGLQRNNGPWLAFAQAGAAGDEETLREAKPTLYYTIGFGSERDEKRWILRTSCPNGSKLSECMIGGNYAQNLDSETTQLNLRSARLNMTSHSVVVQVVTSESLKTLDGISLKLNSNEGHEWSGISDSDGRFEFKNVCKKCELTLVAQRPLFIDEPLKFSKKLSDTETKVELKIENRYQVIVEFIEDINLNGTFDEKDQLLEISNAIPEIENSIISAEGGKAVGNTIFIPAAGESYVKIEEALIPQPYILKAHDTEVFEWKTSAVKRFRVLLVRDVRSKKLPSN